MRQQFSGKGYPDGIVARAQPFAGGTVLDFHPDGVDGYHKDKQHQYARSKSVAQVYGVVQPRIVQRMGVDDNRLQECHCLLFRCAFGV